MTITPTEAVDLFRQPPTRHIDVGNGAAAHRQVGSGPDVLFVHGWPVSGATFRRLLPHFADHVTCHVIDLPGAGSSRFDESTSITVDSHIETVRRTVDALDLDSVSVVGHDSGGMFARHALAGDERVRAFGLLNTELSGGNSWRFNSFIRTAKLPGFERALGWLAGKPALRRNKFVLGDAFADRSHLDGEFDEFFLRPLNHDAARRSAAGRLGRSFESRHIAELSSAHSRIDVPVRLVWGDQDPFFPAVDARQEVATFADASLVEIPGAGLFVHEEAPEAVATALLPVLT